MAPPTRCRLARRFTGLILVNTFYWCTNQGIVQRTLASKSLAEGQKGALLTAVLKMLDPLVLVLPGLIAFHLYQDLPKADMAYPTLVNNVLPTPLVGFFGAVLFGAVISTFNGFLNSASTLFSMGIYRRVINENAQPERLVRVGRQFGLFIAIISILVAPWIANAPEGLYSWMKQLNGIYNVPLVTIIIMGFFFPRIPALAAKVAMGIGIVSYITINYLVKFDFHFLYVLACTFCINVVVMLMIGAIAPRATPFKFQDAFAVDMKTVEEREDRRRWHSVCDGWRLFRPGAIWGLQYPMVDDLQLRYHRGGRGVSVLQQLAGASFCDCNMSLLTRRMKHDSA
ncbi:putative symporter YidK [Salmonella enterica subsp. arizonae]|uniref:Putative symporter YidK n=1 Tax=Salmonella enterica subsp. arizonae TaxID=59203 RepID=A0A379T3Z0_SALER|nr:putative symporter YidK [Salmonella enterica subsp. arizonae]